MRQELEVARSNFKSAEDLLHASHIEKEQRCHKLESDIRNLENRLKMSTSV